MLGKVMLCSPDIGPQFDPQEHRNQPPQDPQHHGTTLIKSSDPTLCVCVCVVCSPLSVVAQQGETRMLGLPLCV